MRSPSSRKTLQAFLGPPIAFPVEARATQHAGLLREELEGKGTTVDSFDLIVGCTALQMGEDVVSRNRKDFERIPGLRVLHY